MRIFPRDTAKRVAIQVNLLLWIGLVVVSGGVLSLEFSYPGWFAVVFGSVLFAFGLWGTINAIYSRR